MLFRMNIFFNPITQEGGGHGSCVQLVLTPLEYKYEHQYFLSFPEGKLVQIICGSLTISQLEVSNLELTFLQEKV